MTTQVSPQRASAGFPSWEFLSCRELQQHRAWPSRAFPFRLERKRVSSHCPPWLSCFGSWYSRDLCSYHSRPWSLDSSHSSLLAAVLEILQVHSQLWVGALPFPFDWNAFFQIATGFESLYKCHLNEALPDHPISNCSQPLHPHLLHPEGTETVDILCIAPPPTSGSHLQLWGCVHHSWQLSILGMSCFSFIFWVFLQQWSLLSLLGADLKAGRFNILMGTSQMMRDWVGG